MKMNYSHFNNRRIMFQPTLTKKNCIKKSFLNFYNLKTKFTYKYKKTRQKKKKMCRSYEDAQRQPQWFRPKYN